LLLVFTCICRKVRSSSKQKGFVNFSTLLAVWDCDITKTAVWEIAFLYVSILARVPLAHDTVQVA
jgi:hypothetical protein